MASSSAERIIGIAAALFARHGFHGVTTRQVAAAAGLNIATVNYHVGSKQDLYDKVQAYFRSQEQAFIRGLVEDAVRNPVSETPALHDFLADLVDRMVEFWNRNPVVVRFQVRHWLDTQEPLITPETETTLDLYQKIDEALHVAQQAGTIKLDVDTGLFLRGLYMLIFGYFLSGAFDWQALQGDPHDPEHLTRFKMFILSYLCKMLNIPSNDTPGPA